MFLPNDRIQFFTDLHGTVKLAGLSEQEIVTEVNVRQNNASGIITDYTITSPRIRFAPHASISDSDRRFYGSHTKTTCY